MRRSCMQARAITTPSRVSPKRPQNSSRRVESLARSGSRLIRKEDGNPLPGEGVKNNEGHWKSSNTGRTRVASPWHTAPLIAVAESPRAGSD
jgi:hypothetical protein